MAAEQESERVAGWLYHRRVVWQLIKAPCFLDSDIFLLRQFKADNQTNARAQQLRAKMQNHLLHSFADDCGFSSNFFCFDFSRREREFTIGFIKHIT